MGVLSFTALERWHTHSTLTSGYVRHCLDLSVVSWDRFGVISLTLDHKMMVSVVVGTPSEARVWTGS